MSSSLLGCSLRNSACAGMTISKAITKTWIAMLFAMLRAVGAPVFLKMLFASMVVTKATSIGRDKFDLQILNARFREINDAQNPLVIQAIVDGQEQRALFRRSATQNRRNARGQFGYRDLLIRQGHLTVLRDPLPRRRREDGARCGPDAQDQLGFGNRGRRIGGGSRDID